MRARAIALSIALSIGAMRVPIEAPAYRPSTQERQATSDREWESPGCSLARKPKTRSTDSSCDEKADCDISVIFPRSHRVVLRLLRFGLEQAAGRYESIIGADSALSKCLHGPLAMVAKSTLSAIAADPSDSQQAPPSRPPEQVARFANLFSPCDCFPRAHSAPLPDGGASFLVVTLPDLALPKAQSVVSAAAGLGLQADCFRR